MGKFSKYSNPAKRKKRHGRKSPFSAAYIEERRQEMYSMLTGDPVKDEYMMKAFDVTIYT